MRLRSQQNRTKNNFHDIAMSAKVCLLFIDCAAARNSKRATQSFTQLARRTNERNVLLEK